MNQSTIMTKIKEVKELHDEKAMVEIIRKMQPLTKKYIRKMYFMEKEDAAQELNLALIEAVKNIKVYVNEAMCITYLQKCVINKYNYLSKMNIKEENFFDKFCELSEDSAIIENFKIKEIELYVFLGELLTNLNENQKKIVMLFAQELNDTEISLRMGVSRQYINRFRRNFTKKINMSLKS